MWNPSSVENSNLKHFNLHDKDATDNLINPAA
jgi:hypothetical protein